jgi:hypothetical protein
MSFEVESSAPPTAGELEKALQELVDVLMEYRARQRRRRAGQPVTHFRAMNWKTSPEVLDAQGWTKDPIGRALKKAIRHVGQLLRRAAKHLLLRSLPRANPEHRRFTATSSELLHNRCVDDWGVH